MNVLDDFSDIFSTRQHLVLLPISRLVLEDEIHLGEFILYPPQSVDLAQLRTVRIRAIEGRTEFARSTCLDGQQLREQLTALTGCNLEVFSRSALLAFRITLDWDQFLGANHREDIALLRRLNQTGESALDVIRFEHCRFDLPDTLPGRVGSWDGSGQHWGALLYNPSDHESYLIAGAASPPTAIVRGLGLEIAENPSIEPPDGGEVGAIAKHSLTLFRDVLEASTETLRFTRAMTLLEFLASPDAYSRMQDVKKEIACHVACDPASYQGILERFQELSHRKTGDKQHGLRTLIIHHGKYLEDILPVEEERYSLFRELQGYASCVIRHMLDQKLVSWEEFLEYRKERRRSIGVTKDH